jgi:hypothetical protein
LAISHQSHVTDKKLAGSIAFSEREHPHPDELVEQLNSSAHPPSVSSPIAAAAAAESITVDDVAFKLSLSSALFLSTSLSPFSSVPPTAPFLGLPPELALLIIIDPPPTVFPLLLPLIFDPNINCGRVLSLVETEITVYGVYPACPFTSYAGGGVFGLIESGISTTFLAQSL